MTQRGPDKTKRVVVGGSASLTGAGLSTTLVTTDEQHLQVLSDVIDDKRVFWAAWDVENVNHVRESILEVRKLATATRSLCESKEASEIAAHIATACRTFIADFDPGSVDPRVSRAQLEALRKSVRSEIARAREVFHISLPDNLDIKTEELELRSRSR